MGLMELMGLWGARETPGIAGFTLGTVDVLPGTQGQDHLGAEIGATYPYEILSKVDCPLKFSRLISAGVKNH